MPDDAVVEFSVYDRGLRLSILHGPGCLRFPKSSSRNVHVLEVAGYTFIHQQFWAEGIWADNIWAIAPGYPVTVEQEGDYYCVSYGIDPAIADLIATEALARLEQT